MDSLALNDGRNDWAEAMMISAFINTYSVY